MKDGIQYTPELDGFNALFSIHHIVPKESVSTKMIRVTRIRGHSEMQQAPLGSRSYVVPHSASDESEITCPVSLSFFLDEILFVEDEERVRELELAAEVWRDGLHVD